LPDPRRRKVSTGPSGAACEIEISVPDLPAVDVRAHDLERLVKLLRLASHDLQESR
jgi:hypothetical protein